MQRWPCAATPTTIRAPMSLTTVQWSLTTRQGLSLALAISLVGSSASAAPPVDQSDAATDALGTVENADDASEGGGGSPSAEEDETGPSPDLIVETEEPESSAGIGGSVISSTNPEARRARADLEGTALLDEEPSSDVPERLPPMQRAAWWTMFGTFALATTGGVFAGMAEVQEDRALRLASTVDLTTGGAYLYGDKQGEYQEILDKGERQAWIARGFLIGAGVTLIAGIALFAVDAKRRKEKPNRARLRPTGSGLEVRF